MPLLPVTFNWLVKPVDPVVVVVPETGVVCVIELGVTVSVKIQVPVLPWVSESVPETVSFADGQGATRSRDGAQGGYGEARVAGRRHVGDRAVITRDVQLAGEARRSGCRGRARNRGGLGNRTCNPCDIQGICPRTGVAVGVGVRT